MTTRIPLISGFSRGGVKVSREGFGVALQVGDKDALLPSFEARELAVALLLLSEEAETRHELHRLGWTPEAIEDTMCRRAEEARK